MGEGPETTEEHRAAQPTVPSRSPALDPVDAAGARELVDAGLARLAGSPLGEHPRVYQEIHAGLESALADIDDA